MTLVFNRVSEAWSKHGAFPSNTGTIVWTVTDDAGADVTTDAAIAAAAGGIAGSDSAQCHVGGQSYSLGDVARPMYVKEVAWTQDTPKMATATTRLDSTLFIGSGYDEDTVQSVTDTVSGYVNTDLSATTYDVSWWRYKDPADWVIAGTPNTYPWTFTVPAVNHQVALLNVADSVKVDAGGTPLKRPILGQQLTVSLTFTAKPTTLRAEWRSLRGTRNNATFLGDLQGEWLFTGANQRASTNDSLYYVELSFYRDPFGWCRQRAQSGPNGVFRKDLELEEITNPADTVCPATGTSGTNKMLVASCVDWVQLHPGLGNFSDLFTTAQLAQVADLIA